MKLYKIAGISLIVVIIASLAVGTLAFAQDNDTNPESQPMTGPRFKPGGDAERPMGPGARQGRAAKMDEITLAIVAEALGLTPAELQAELDAGKMLPEIAEELGVDETELRQAFSDARVAHIEQAVADGKLTQEQADAMLARMAEQAALAEAREALYNYQLEQALSDGAITQEQADLLAELGNRGAGKAPVGQIGQRGRGGNRPMRQAPPNDN